MSNPKHDTFLKGMATGLALSALILFLCMVFAPGAHAANTQGPRWLVLGDDILNSVVEQGVIPTADQNTLAHLQRKAPVTIQNLSVGPAGYAYNPAPVTMASLSLAAYKAQGVIIALGTHDWGTGQNLTAVAAGVARVVAEAKKAGLKVVCLTPIRRTNDLQRHGPNPGQQSALGHALVPNASLPRQTYSGLIAGQCSMAGGQVIIGYTAPIFLQSNYGNDFGFRLHLNAAGHDALSTWLVERMRALGHWQ